jgi:hypothetical protein
MFTTPEEYVAAVRKFGYEKPFGSETEKFAGETYYNYLKAEASTNRKSELLKKAEGLPEVRE